MRPCVGPKCASCRYVCPDGVCALDVADEGEHELGEVAAHFGVSKQRIHQVERTALRKLKRLLAAQGVRHAPAMGSMELLSSNFPDASCFDDTFSEGDLREMCFLEPSRKRAAAKRAAKRLAERAERDAA